MAIPITVITGFLGSGKTTIILNLIPQLPEDYKLALLKNEFGDLAIDSQLATSASISGVEELLNGCICCNLVGQLGDALDTLRKDVKPNRIIIETSGSAFPATLALEINRLARETGNYILDGVISVIDVENWQGYEDISVTARMQAKYTDLIIFNKWELVDERKYDICLDRVGDLEVQVAIIKSTKGTVSKDLLFGIDGSLARIVNAAEDLPTGLESESHHHNHSSGHQNEVDVLSCVLSCSTSSNDVVDLDALHIFLSSAPKDEVYRIKAFLITSSIPVSSDGQLASPNSFDGQYLLNWAFGRWTYAAAPSDTSDRGTSPSQESLQASENRIILRMTVITAQGESSVWQRNLESAQFGKTGSAGGSLAFSVSRYEGNYL